MIFIKYCKKCRKAFDIGINYNLCPKCRRDINRDERGLKNNGKEQKL